MSSVDKYHKQLKEKHNPGQDPSKPSVAASPFVQPAKPASPASLGPVQPGYLRLEYDCSKCNAKYAFDLPDEMKNHIADYYRQNTRSPYEIPTTHAAQTPSGDPVIHEVRLSVGRDFKVKYSRWVMTKRES
jgi:hypothetical protein